MSSNLYLITGDEQYVKQEKMNNIIESFGEYVKGINFITIDKNNIKNLEDEIKTCSFGYSKKLIIVKVDKKEKKAETSENSGETNDEEIAEEKNDWFTESLEKTIKEMEDVTLVFTGDIKKTTKLFKFVQKNGECIVCEKKKEYDLLSWISKMFKENLIEISNSDINYLINLAGTDMLTLKNEVDKLIDYAYDSKKITKKEIDLICIRTSDVIIFDLTDNIGNKNVIGAMQSLDELIENKEPIQKIIIMIAKHFKSLLVAKVATIEGKNVLEELSTNSAYAANKYKAQARSFSLDELKDKIKCFSELDIDSKTGKIDPRIGLEKIICN